MNTRYVSTGIHAKEPRRKSLARFIESGYFGIGADAKRGLGHRGI